MINFLVYISLSCAFILLHNYNAKINHNQDIKGTQIVQRSALLWSCRQVLPALGQVLRISIRLFE